MFACAKCILNVRFANRNSEIVNVYVLPLHVTTMPRLALLLVVDYCSLSILTFTYLVRVSLAPMPG